MNLWSSGPVSTRVEACARRSSEGHCVPLGTAPLAAAAAVVVVVVAPVVHAYEALWHSLQRGAAMDWIKKKIRKGGAGSGGGKVSGDAAAGDGAAAAPAMPPMPSEEELNAMFAEFLVRACALLCLHPACDC